MRLALSVGILVAAVLSGCTSTVVGPEYDYPLLTNAVGTVVSLSADGAAPFVLEVEEPYATRVGGEIPTRFQREGLQVVFSGAFFPIEPNVRYAALPFELSRIEPAR